MLRQRPDKSGLHGAENIELTPSTLNRIPYGKTELNIPLETYPPWCKGA